MKDIEVSLYDIFGYLFPGATALSGVYFAAFPIAPSVAQDWTHVTLGGWVAMLLVAYLFGHLIQALAHALLRSEKPSPEERILGQNSSESRQSLTRANVRAKLVLGLTSGAELDPLTLYDVMDHFLRQNGRTSDRDVFVYREGFYRGMWASLLVFALGCTIGGGGAPVSLAAFGLSLVLSRPILLVCGVGGAVAALLMFWRYQRFADYRVRNALYGFLTVRSPL